MITNDPSPLSNLPTIDPEPAQEQTSYTSATPADRPPGTVSPWRQAGIAFISWFSSVVFLLFVPLIVGIPYMVYLMSKGAIIDGPSLLQDKTFLFIQIAAVIPAHVFTLIMVWLLVTRWGKLGFVEALKITWPPGVGWLRGVAICSVIAVLLLGLGFVITKFLGGGKTELDQLIESSFSARLATAFLAVATAPLVEEVIYRGMLYPAIQRLLGIGWAVLVVAMMFALVHVWQYRNNVGVILVITILSVVLTLVRAWTDRLLPSIVIHTIFNGVQSIILVLQPFVEKPEKLEPAPTFVILFKAIRYLF